MRKKITSLLLAIVMFLGMNAALPTKSYAAVGDNIFNGGNSMMADSYGQWGLSFNGAVTNAALWWDGTATPCYPSLALQPNKTYTVRVLARAGMAGSPAVNTDEANKVCFQYKSSSEEAAGANAWDKFNLYITRDEWAWYEGTFTTPKDMYGTFDPYGSITIRNGYSNLYVEQMIVSWLSMISAYRCGTTALTRPTRLSNRKPPYASWPLRPFGLTANR